MQITKLLNDKEIKHGLLLIDKYPKPINKNNKSKRMPRCLLQQT